MSWAWLHRYASPPIFFRIAGRVIPWVSWLAAIAGAAGLIGGLGLAPAGLSARGGLPDYLRARALRGALDGGLCASWPLRPVWV